MNNIIKKINTNGISINGKIKPMQNSINLIKTLYNKHFDTNLNMMALPLFIENTNRMLFYFNAEKKKSFFLFFFNKVIR